MALVSLQRLLDVHRLAHNGVRLLGAEDQILAAKAADTDLLRPHEHDVVSLPLPAAPWRLELQVNRIELAYAALQARAGLIGSVFVLAASIAILFLLVRSARRMHSLSIRDALTGLHNRRYFDEVLPVHFEAARRGRYRLGLAILDVDFFKKYNDHYDHQQGDEALASVAKALQGAMRRGTDQVFRIGGAEFAVAVHLAEAESFEPLLEAINQAVRDLRMPRVGNTCGVMTISVGAVVVSHANWVDLGAAYKLADEALYETKSGGRDRFVVRQLLAKRAVTEG